MSAGPAVVGLSSAAIASLNALAQALDLGETAAPLLLGLHAFYAEIDADIGARAAPTALPCAQGCDACCHESVFVSAPEFLGAAAALLALGPAETQRVVAEMGQLAQRFADELELLELLSPGAERDEVAARIAFRCPLLSRAGACMIYGSRELNARSFGQTWDELRGEAYGCTLTHARLRVLPAEEGPRLYSAREARRKLVAAVPGAGQVRVYPWWFERYGALLDVR